MMIHIKINFNFLFEAKVKYSSSGIGFKITEPNEALNAGFISGTLHQPALTMDI